MERHQHGVVQILPHLGRFGYMLLTNRSFSQQAWWFSVGNVPPLGTKRYPLPLIAFNFFLVSTQNNRSVVWIFVIFRGLFGHFYALTEFLMHFMCIIQIWTTCTCSSAYKLVENSNLCPWVGRMQEMGMNVKHPATVTRPQTLRYLVFKF